MFNFIKKTIISNRVEETILYECVLDELEDGFKVRGLWGKALAMSEGDENKATSLYMQYRVQNIKDYFTALKITYEELSKSQIKNKLVDLNKKNYDNQNDKVSSITENNENIKQEIDEVKVICLNCGKKNDNNRTICWKCKQNLYSNLQKDNLDYNYFTNIKKELNYENQTKK